MTCECGHEMLKPIEECEHKMMHCEQSHKCKFEQITCWYEMDIACLECGELIAVGDSSL